MTTTETRRGECRRERQEEGRERDLQGDSGTDGGDVGRKRDCTLSRSVIANV